MVKCCQLFLQVLFSIVQAETLAAGVIVGLMGENEVNKDPTLTNTAQADPIEDFQDNSGDPDFTVSIKSMLLTLLFTQHLLVSLGI